MRNLYALEKHLKQTGKSAIIDIVNGIMKYLIGVYLVYVLCLGVTALSCTSDADCPDGNNFICNDAGQCECPPSYFLHVNYCIYNCGIPPDFEVDDLKLNYTLHIGNSLEGDFAYYNCPKGYVMTGNDESRCEEGGWSDAQPVCLRDCGNLPVIANGNLTLDNAKNTFVNSSASVRCDDGYIPSQSGIRCTDTGEWETATCQFINCGNLPVIDNGNVLLDKSTNTAKVNCDVGYIGSISFIKCLNTGKWESVSCLPIDCGDVGPPENGHVDKNNGTSFGSVATYSCNEEFTIVGDKTRVCSQNGNWSNMRPDCLQDGAKRCAMNIDTRGTVWNEVAAGRIRTKECKTNFTGTIRRQCGEDGFWKIPEYLCMRESVSNAITMIDLLSGQATQQDILNALQELTAVTTHAESIVEEDKLTDLEMRSLITSSSMIANLLSASPNLISNEVTNVLTEILSNLIDDKNTGSWKTLAQTSSNVAEEIFFTVDSLSNAMAQYVATTRTTLQPVVKQNLALHVRIMTSDKFVFPGSDTVQETSSNNWLKETKSQINFDPASFDGLIIIDEKANQFVGVVKAAMFKDISNIMPDKSENEQLNGQILSFSTMPPLPDPFDPPIKMSFEHNDLANTQMTIATCSFWKFGESGGDGFWSSEGCSSLSSTEGLTECVCNHTTNFAIILSFIDCGTLDNPANGNVMTPEGTILNKEAVYNCNQGYTLNGTVTRICMSTGSWSSSSPSCIKTEERKTTSTCFEDVDSRGLIWPETMYGNTHDKNCPDGFTGKIARTCGSDGLWKLPQYDCIRESVVTVNEKVSDLNENSTEEDIDNVLGEILNVTSANETTNGNYTLTDGELKILTSSLEAVANVLETSSTALNEKIAEEFIEIASNLVDDSTHESWQALSQSEENDGSEKLLKTVDSLANILSRTIKDDAENNGTIIVKKNIALEVKKISNKDVIFPDTATTLPDKSDENSKWFEESSSSLRLDANALTNTSATYISTAVIYRDLSKILPNRRGNETKDIMEDSEYTINAPILSLTISPPVTYTLDPPLRLTYTHNQVNFTDPWCVFWVFTNADIGQGFWSSDGCVVNTTSNNFTVCECNHLTNFALLMSPFIEADAASETLRVISMVGIGISIACLALTIIVHISFWRYLKSDRTTALFNLCLALLLSYILFLSGIDRTESSAACSVVAAVLQYIYLVVFCIMLVEGIEIAITVLYVFKTKSRIKIMLVFAWVIPAIIVGISLGVTEVEGYGNDEYCWLSVDNGLIWAFVGPALGIITFNGFCLGIVIRVMFKTKTISTKKASEKVKTSFRTLCVLVPVMGVSWIIGIFYMSGSFYFVQYIFAILNGLQGFFIFLFHCLLNEQVKIAIRLLIRRRSSANETFLNSSREERKSKDLRDMKTSVVDSGQVSQAKNNRRESEKIKRSAKLEKAQVSFGNGKRRSIET